MFENLHRLRGPQARRACSGRGTTSAALLLMALGLALSGNSAAQGDPAAGQAKSVTCGACHGSDGNSVNPEWPSLAGQHAGYTVRQLQAYQSNARNNVLMIGQAAALSEQDMWDLAAYYETQALRPMAAAPGDLALGQRIYRGGNPATGVSACIACHGPRGLGNPVANYPRVSGQYARYLYDTLRHYANGERQSDDGRLGQMMRSIASRMSDEEMRAVTAYMQGLQ
jgi:cytochrome c553